MDSEESLMHYVHRKVYEEPIRFLGMFEKEDKAHKKLKVIAFE